MVKKGRVGLTAWWQGPPCTPPPPPQPPPPPPPTHTLTWPLPRSLMDRELSDVQIRGGWSDMQGVSYKIERYLLLGEVEEKGGERERDRKRKGGRRESGVQAVSQTTQTQGHLTRMSWHTAIPFYPAPPSSRSLLPLYSHSVGH